MGSLVPEDDYSNGDEDVSGKCAKAASAAMERQAGGSMMEQLVPEITTHALSYLDYPSLCRLSMTNSSMRRAANDDNAWKMLYHKDFTLEQDNITPDKGWKAYYASTKAVVTVNAEFFNVITERSAGSMRRLWLNADYVKCILGTGQFGVSLSGYNAVMESFEMAIHWVQDEGINFEVQDVRARIAGNMAWVTMKAYVEIAGGPFHVTNVFEFHNGQWLMVHHHSSGMLVVGGMAQHQLLGLFERSTMGCVNSKSGFKMDDDFVDSFNLDPESKAEFDLNTVGESWLMTLNTVGESWLTTSKSQSTSHVPVSLLEKVDSSLNLELRSWSEVSKALEDLKPSLEKHFPEASTSWKSIEKKSHTVEEVDEIINLSSGSLPISLSVGLPQPMRRNSFILRDKHEKQKERSRIKNPLDGLKKMCPPGGSESVVLYTTSIHSVRRTFEDCEKARMIVELQCLLGVDIDERDVSIHGEYLRDEKSTSTRGRGRGCWNIIKQLEY